MKDTMIFDDIVDSEFQDKILNMVMMGNWKFINDMSYKESEYPSYGLNQTFKHPEYGIMTSLYETVCVPIINKVIQKNILEINDIHFTRSFLQFPLNDKFVKEHNGIHIDLPISHYACVYYCNDSDGDTIIYEQTVKNTPCGSVNVNLVEHKRVTPKKGRMVLFDGFRYHCSSQPTSNYRCIINFDLV